MRVVGARNGLGSIDPLSEALLAAFRHLDLQAKVTQFSSFSSFFLSHRASRLYDLDT